MLHEIVQQATCELWMQPPREGEIRCVEDAISAQPISLKYLHFLYLTSNFQISPETCRLQHLVPNLKSGMLGALS